MKIECLLRRPHGCASVNIKETQRLDHAVSEGPRAVLLERPVPVALQEAEHSAALAADCGVVVAVDTAYAANPLWRTVLPLIAQDVAGAGLLDAVATVDEDAGVDAAMLALLGVVRPLVPGEGLRAVRRQSPGCVAGYGADGTAITVAAVAAAGTPALELSLVGASRRWRVLLPADATALPAEAAVHDAGGARAFRPVFESAARATWRGLHDQLHGRPGGFHRLGDLVDDLRLHAGVLP